MCDCGGGVATLAGEVESGVSFRQRGGLLEAEIRVEAKKIRAQA
jgi:hypothetical protein